MTAHIPGSVSVLNFRIFYGCTNLNSITLSEGVSHFDRECFADCVSLKSIEIPASAKYFMSGDIFAGCDSLTEIIVSDRNTYYDSRFSCNAIIETTSNKLIAGCKGSVIPQTIETVGEFAFAGRSGILNVFIPANVKHIGNYAFYACDDLQHAVISSSTVEISVNAFAGCTKMGYIYICSTDAQF